MKPLLFSKTSIPQSSSFICRVLQLLCVVPCLCVVVLLALPAYSQTDSELRFLVFDAVALAPVASVPGSANEATATADSPALIDPALIEIAPQSSESKIDLRSWLANSAAETNQQRTSLAEDIARHEEAIKELEFAEGPFAPGLAQHMLDLGNALQNNGDLVAAQEYFEKATHVTRINLGLFSTAQIPFIERIIDNQLRQGNLLAADSQQNYLYFLQQKNYGLDNAELLPALNRFAEWNMYAFSNGSRLLGLSSEESNNRSRQENNIDELTFRVQRLINAQHIYWYIAEIIRNNFGKDDPRLLDAEMRLVLTNFIYATYFAWDTAALSEINTSAGVTARHLDSPSITSMGYRHGFDALERRISYLEDLPETDPVELAQAKLDLADWMLYFNKKRSKALALYKESYTTLSPKVNEEKVAALFAPSFPARLPTFITHTYTRQALGIPPGQGLNYKGYIDIEMSLSRFGNPQEVRVRGKSPDTTFKIEDRLIRSLRRTQFRPRFRDGELLLKDTLLARFYYTW